jgi:hypothetical protein
VPESSKRTFPFRFPLQNCVCISNLMCATFFTLLILFDNPNNVLCNIINMLIVCSGELVNWSTTKVDYQSFWVSATACSTYLQHPSTPGGHLHLQPKDVSHHANRLKCLRFWILTFSLLWMKHLVMYTLLLEQFLSWSGTVTSLLFCSEKCHIHNTQTSN